MAPRRKSARIAQKPAQPQSSYRLDSNSLDSDLGSPPPLSDDGESDVYTSDAQHTDSDSDDHGHDQLAGSVADDLDLGGREPSSTKKRSKSARNKPLAGSAADDAELDKRSWAEKRAEEKAQRYPSFRHAAWVLAHPPRKAFKRDGTTLERSWMNRRLPYTFKNNNTRMKTSDGIELFARRPTVDGPASPPKKGGRKKATTANRTKKYGDWADPQHGTNELNMPPDFLKFLWDDGMPGETPKEPLAIEDRQVVRCDENFGLHDHANDDAANPDGFTCCESRKSHLDIFMKQRREEMIAEKQQDDEARAREQQQEPEQGSGDEQQKSDSSDDEESDDGDDEDSDDARSNKKKKAAKAKKAAAQKARRSSARWGPSLRIKDSKDGNSGGVSISDRVLLGEVYEWESHDFAICGACDDHQTAHIESESSLAKAQDGLFHGAMTPLCQTCALHAVDTLGHGYNGCRCDSERRCLPHRVAHLEELADAREAYVSAHQPEDPAMHPALQDGDADGYPQVSPVCPHCRTNFPPPVPAHFAYACMRCDEEVVLPAPEDNMWQGVGEEPQAFVKNLPRPVKDSLHLLEQSWDWNADWVDIIRRYAENPLPEDEDDEAAVAAAPAAVDTPMTAGGEDQAITSTAPPTSPPHHLQAANTKRKRAPSFAAASSASSSASGTDDDNDDERQRGLKHARVDFARKRVTSTAYSASNSNNAEAAGSNDDEDEEEDLVESQGSQFCDAENSMYSDAVDEYADDEDEEL
ncbi:hypothetical protein SLS54_005080 [Diplodia seriata]